MKLTALLSMLTLPLLLTACGGDVGPAPTPAAPAATPAKEPKQETTKDTAQNSDQDSQDSAKNSTKDTAKAEVKDAATTVTTLTKDAANTAAATVAEAPPEPSIQSIPASKMEMKIGNADSLKKLANGGMMANGQLGASTGMHDALAAGRTVCVLRSQEAASGALSEKSVLGVTKLENSTLGANAEVKKISLALNDQADALICLKSSDKDFSLKEVNEAVAGVLEISAGQ